MPVTKTDAYIWNATPAVLARSLEWSEDSHWEVAAIGFYWALPQGAWDYGAFSLSPSPPHSLSLSLPTNLSLEVCCFFTASCCLSLALGPSSCLSSPFCLRFYLGLAVSFSFVFVCCFSSRSSLTPPPLTSAPCYFPFPSLPHSLPLTLFLSLKPTFYFPFLSLSLSLFSDLRGGAVRFAHQIWYFFHKFFLFGLIWTFAHWNLLCILTMKGSLLVSFLQM